MRKIRDILRLHFEEGRSQRQIAEALNLRSKSTAGEVIRKARDVGLSWPLEPDLDDENKLEGLLFKRRPKSKKNKAPDWRQVQRQLEERDVTLEKLWREYRDRVPDGYSYPHFCRLFREYRNRSNVIPFGPKGEARTREPAGEERPPAPAKPEDREPEAEPVAQSPAPDVEEAARLSEEPASPGETEPVRPPEEEPVPAREPAGEMEELRHLDFLGLRSNPFPVAPDEENFFISSHIEQVLTELVHGIVTRKGFMILTGDVGLGKTTISRRLMRVLEEKGVETSLVFHTTYQDVELLREINRDFGIERESLVFGDQMKALNDFLLEKSAQGVNCAIVIDDAQNLDERSIELIRMISNLESDRRKLVQILLIGQPEMMDRLSRPALRQVMSRIIIKEEVRPLGTAELSEYLEFKLGAAGSRGGVSVSRPALALIHRRTRGNFRQINILMDRCLYTAFLHGAREIGPAIVRESLADLRFKVNRPAGRAWLWGALALVVILGLGVWVFQADRPSPAPPRSVAAPPTPAPVAEPASEPAPAPAPAVEPAEPAVPEALSRFLAAQGLTEYEADLYEALKLGDIEALGRRIFADTGRQLVRLDTVPGYVRERYGLLAYPFGPGGEESYFLFWKPPVVIEKFYFRYAGPEIEELQKRLADLELYNDKIDNVVGRKMMKAVTDFQNIMGLDVTGVPDPRTVFLIYHESGLEHE